MAPKVQASESKSTEAAPQPLSAPDRLRQLREDAATADPHSHMVRLIDIILENAPATEPATPATGETAGTSTENK